ncbi:MAG TPA: hypothetical protein VMV10_20905 [Pirellulales bacterium]|nr:hypothetical protein [Pirellulales bacterium]
MRYPTERPEYLKAKAHVILFLRRAIEERGEGRGWLGVDPWFAVQPATKPLERALARLADAPPLKRDEREDHEEIGEDSLLFYKSRASLVVSGDITEISKPLYADDSTCTRALRIKVGRIMRGGVQGDEIAASVVRLEDESSEPPFLKKGGRVILFLRERKGDPRYETVDPWFGIQQGNSDMEELLDEVFGE